MDRSFAGDRWSQWLLQRRYGGDADYRKAVDSRVIEYADLVLQHARPQAGETLLDVGAGTGLVAFRALEQCPTGLTVTLTDISAQVLEEARAVADGRGLTTKCRFLTSSAENMADVADRSIDVVVARSAIAYVRDKRAAFREMLRVLKPGGRLSIAEPINQQQALSARVLRQQVLACEGEPDTFLRLMHRWKSAQYPDTEEGYADTPLVNFSEEDLLAFAGRAGFRPLHLRMHVDLIPSPLRTWEAFVSIAPHPLAPTLREIMESSFTSSEREEFERHLRPGVESGVNVDIERMAYLFGSRPISD